MTLHLTPIDPASADAEARLERIKQAGPELFAALQRLLYAWDDAESWAFAEAVYARIHDHQPSN